MKDLQNPQYRLRKVIGVLGLALPILLIVGQKDLLSSISHYYYTSVSIFFIGILFAFGLVLFTYKGYPVDPDSNEKVSDDWVTTLAAICITIAVLVPINCEGSLGELLFCGQGYLFGYRNNPFKSTLHLVSAGSFLGLLGFMCVKKFTRSKNQSLKRKRFYKICGYIVWGCIGLLIILYVVEKLILENDINKNIPGYTFILESVAVWAFGIAWLVKGKLIEDIQQLFKKKNGRQHS